MTSATIDWRHAPPFTINRHKEYDVNCKFAPAARIDWLKPGVDPSTQCKALPTEMPTPWKESPGQPILGKPQVQRPTPAPWFYGEAPDLMRLVGNAARGYGS